MNKYRSVHFNYPGYKTAFYGWLPKRRRKRIKWLRLKRAQHARIIREYFLKFCEIDVEPPTWLGCTPKSKSKKTKNTQQYKPGVYPHFSSGLSPTAPLDTLTNMCVPYLDGDLCGICGLPRFHTKVANFTDCQCHRKGFLTPPKS